MSSTCMKMDKTKQKINLIVLFFVFVCFFFSFFSVLWLCRFSIDCDRLNKQNNQEASTNQASKSFTTDITPLILASHKDNYEIIKILLDRGEQIPEPVSFHEIIDHKKMINFYQNYTLKIKA